jgi:hypothetical protein
MSGQVLSLAPGSRLVFDGEVAEVVAVDGVRVTLRNDRTRRFTAVQISRLAADLLIAAPGDRCRLVVAGGTLTQGVVVVADGECGVADLADGVVEVAEGFCDALPDQLRGQVDGCLQAEPDMEKAGDGRVEQFLASMCLLCRDCRCGEVGEFSGQCHPVLEGVDQLPHHRRGDGCTVLVRWRDLGRWPSGAAGRRVAVGSGPGTFGDQGEYRCWRPGGGGRFQGRVDGDQAVQAVDAEHAPDDLGGNHQPQLRAADDGPLKGAPPHPRPRGHEIVAVMSAINVVAPRLMTDSSSSRISPALDRPICSGSATIACRPVHCTG